jgi:ADP-heptose:LPS heptosyltransferase
VLGLGGGAYAVLAPGAGWSQKRWPAEEFSAVGRALAAAGLRLVVTGVESERELCDRVAAGAGGGLAVVGRRLGEVIALLEGADAVLSNDSGVAQLAAALGVRTAAVFTGATDPRRCGPLGPEGQVRVLVPPVRREEVVAHLAARARRE